MINRVSDSFKKGCIIAIALLFLFFLISPICIAQEDVNGGEEGKSTPPLPSWMVATIVVIIVLAGLWVLYIGYKSTEDKNLCEGELRRAIAASLVLGFVIIAVLSMVYEVQNKEIVSSYTQLVGVIIGFYFGSKITSEAEIGKAENTKMVAEDYFKKIAAEAKGSTVETKINQLIEEGKSKLGGK